MQKLFQKILGGECHGECIGGIVGARLCGQIQNAHGHFLDLIFGGVAHAANRHFDALRCDFDDGEAALGSYLQNHAARARDINSCCDVFGEK